MSKFTELVEVDLKEKQIKITVSCKERKLAVEEKIIWEKSINELVPEDYKNKVKLISKPSNTISNLNLSEHSNTGSWIFSILEEKKSNQPTRRKTRRRTKVSSEK